MAGREDVRQDRAGRCVPCNTRCPVRESWEVGNVSTHAVQSPDSCWHMDTNTHRHVHKHKHPHRNTKHTHKHRHGHTEICTATCKHPLDTQTDKHTQCAHTQGPMHMDTGEHTSTHTPITAEACQEKRAFVHAHKIRTFEFFQIFTQNY